MTLESENGRFISMEEKGISYDQLTHKGFFDVIDRFRNLNHIPLVAETFGYVEITGELINGKPIYDLFIEESLLPKQKALTLTHEVVHIFWEEDALGYKDRPVGLLPGYDDGQPSSATHLDIMFSVGEVHEEKVEGEAKKFFKANHTMVLEEYKRMCRNRGLSI